MKQEQIQKSLEESVFDPAKLVYTINKEFQQELDLGEFKAASWFGKAVVNYLSSKWLNEIKINEAFHAPLSIDEEVIAGFEREKRVGWMFLLKGLSEPKSSDPLTYESMKIVITAPLYKSDREKINKGNVEVVSELMFETQFRVYESKGFNAYFDQNWFLKDKHVN